MDASQLQDPSIQTPDQIEFSLLNLINFKDTSTFHHSNRVAALTYEWAQFMRSRSKWLDINVSGLVMAARLHDVGKVGVVERVLSKAGPLTAEERLQMNLHVEIGYELVRDLPMAEGLALAVLHHHERWDGGGYPAGLQGEQIPLFAQIIGIVDAYDAMTSDRSYQKARSSLEALDEINRGAGRQFSPGLTSEFNQFLHARNG